MYFNVITPEEHLLRQAAHELAQSPLVAQINAVYAEHQWLWRFFPSERDQTRDFVFRRHDVDQIPRFYVVSKRRPITFSDAWKVQSQDYLPQLAEGQRLSFQLRANPVVTRPGDPVLDEAGKPKLRSSGKHAGEIKRKVVRHDVVMQAKKQLLAEQGFGKDAKWADWKDESNKPLLYELVQKHCAVWLDGVGKRNGFEIALTDEEEPQRKLQVDTYEQNKAGKHNHNICFSTVDFSGELLVTNPELFQQALFDGLGPAKAFGCGLLLVRKI
uniref:Type I-E CRISPR-associated protein Cas6/Cse3/CasE n=1 Tax=mine drainage metagenome TaxID=410659 RepID=E6QU42_9ZZZZ